MGFFMVFIIISSKFLIENFEEIKNYLLKVGGYNILKIIIIAMLLANLYLLYLGQTRVDYIIDYDSYDRFLSFVVSVFCAYSCYKAILQKKEGWLWFFGATAFLFNPIFKIHLDRIFWGFIDIGLAVVLFISLFTFKLNNEMTKLVKKKE